MGSPRDLRATAGRSRWSIAAACVAIPTLVIGSFYGLSVSPWLQSSHNGAMTNLDISWNAFASDQPSEAPALDDQLRRDYIAAVEFAGETSRLLAKRYQLPVFERASQSIDAYRDKITATTDDTEGDIPSLVRRFLEERAATDPLSALGSILGLGGSGVGAKASNSTAGGGTDIISGLGSLLGLGGGGTNSSGSPVSAIGDLLSSGLAGIANSTLGSLGGAGMFLGIGLGVGAMEGLNMTTADKALAMGARVAAVNNMNATGLNPAIQNAATGATATLIGGVNVSSLFGSVGSLGPIALGLAEGLGNGTVAGLNINNVLPPQGNSTADIAGNFGYGLTRTVASNVNLTAIMSSGSGGLQSSLMSLMPYLPSAASGVGKGIGQGVTVGLGLQPDPGLSMVKPPVNGQIDVGGLAQTFTEGMTSSLLANGTVSKVMAMMSTNSSGGGITSLLPDMDIGSVAQGFIRGLIQGAGDGVTAMGGINALLSGKATMPTGNISETPVNFNDSISGAAVGFGQGLGSQGVLVAQQLMKQVNVITSQSTGSETATPARKRDNGVHTRDVAVANKTALVVNMTALLNADSISTILQKGIDLLSCDGIAGLILVLFGLNESGALPSNLTSSLNATDLQSIVPNGTVHFVNQGNTYDIDLQAVMDGQSSGLLAMANGISINGNQVPKFAAFLALHIIFGLLIATAVLPVILGLEASQNLVRRFKLPNPLATAPKWVNRTWVFVLPPSMLLILIFGILAGGTSAHFRTAHGVLGLITVIISVAAIALHIIRANRAPTGSWVSSDAGAAAPFKWTSLYAIRELTNQLFLIIILPTALTGFSDLGSLALCAVQVVPFGSSIAIGFGLSNIYIIGAAVSGLDLLLAVRYRPGAAANRATDLKKEISGPL